MNSLKVIAINGSPRVGGNTESALKIMGEVFKAYNIDLEILSIGNDTIKGCIGCGYCGKSQTKTCVTHDRINEDIKKLESADGIILASPVYFAGINGTLKAYLDRLFYVSTSNGNFFRHKVGASLAIARRDGGISAVDTLNYYLQYSEMILATSNYWTSGYGTKRDDLQHDAEGVQIFKVLAENFVYLLKMREATKTSIIPVEREIKTFTNFIK